LFILFILVMRGYQLLRIAVVAAISACIICVNAETGNCDPDETGSCTYVLTGTQLTISGSGPMKDWGTTGSTRAPWRTGDCSVTEVTISGISGIGQYAFYNCINLSSVTIAPTVETIGVSAFQGCKSLASISLPEGVKTLGNNSFSGCITLSSINYPSSLTTLNSGVFSNTGFTNFTFPAGFSEIPPNFYSGSSKLRYVDIPEGVTKIGEKAFWNCNNLNTATISSTVTDLPVSAFGRDNQNNNMKNIFVHKDNPNYSDIDGVLCSKDKKTLILFPAYHIARYRIPEGITHIGPYAFDFVNRNFWQINFSSTVTSIAKFAFSNQGYDMYHLIIPANVVHIERNAFDNNLARNIYYLGLHNPDPENLGAFACPATGGFISLHLPIDYEDSTFCTFNVSIKGNPDFDEFRGLDNECYQAFFFASTRMTAQCDFQPPRMSGIKGVYEMRPEVYEKLYNSNCFKYKCHNETGLNITSTKCYFGKVCIDDVCVYPPSSSSSESSSSSKDESHHSHSSGESHQSHSSDGSSQSEHGKGWLDSGLCTTASYVIVTLAMAFTLLI